MDKSSKKYANKCIAIHFFFCWLVFGLIQPHHSFIDVEKFGSKCYIINGMDDINGLQWFGAGFGVMDERENICHENAHRILFRFLFLFYSLLWEFNVRFVRFQLHFECISSFYTKFNSFVSWVEIVTEIPRQAHVTWISFCVCDGRHLRNFDGFGLCVSWTKEKEMRLIFLHWHDNRTAHNTAISILPKQQPQHSWKGFILSFRS